MRILFDQGTPLPLRKYLQGHTVETVFELGWSTLKNGELLAAAEESFDLLITTDQQLRSQQNLSKRNLSVLVLMTTSWLRIKVSTIQILETINQMKSGDYREVTFR
jgi:predicted nuclease of predicted toxin-antitoxin system